MKAMAALSLHIGVLFAFLFAALQPAQAQLSGKHPRVAELEDSLRRTAEQVLGSRFPGQPFSVTVHIAPSFRYEEEDRSSEDASGEELPFLNMQKEELRDEWDDPSVPLLQLVNRTQKIKVELSVPKSVTDEEVDEIKTRIISSLHMSPARDSVEITRRSWSKDTGLAPSLVVAMAVFALLVFGGLFWISHRSVNKISAALKAGSNSGAGTTTIQASISGSPSGPAAGRDAEGSKIEGDLNFKDAYKLRDETQALLNKLLATNAFPMVEDMMELERLGASDSGALGAVLDQMPDETQKLVFGLSSEKDLWTDAMLESTDVSPECVRTLKKLLKFKRSASRPEWSRLLTQVWRMGPQAHEYLKGLGEKRAVMLLRSMPEEIGIALARKSFPGVWGTLLTEKGEDNFITEDDVKRLAEKAYKMFPLKDWSSIDQSRKEKSLLAYVRTLDPTDEREIYMVLPDKSRIKTNRPPFYKLFEAERPVREQWVKSSNTEDLAKALAGLSQDFVSKILECTTPKQSIMLTERLAQYEKKPPGDTESRGLLREKMAREVAELEAKHSVQSESGGEESAASDSDDDTALPEAA